MMRWPILFILDSEVGVLWLFRGVCVGCVQIFVTFSAVFGVAVYRICMLSVWSMNPDPEAKASVRMTVTTTGIILNMLVVLVLEEVYGAIAVWLTELGDVWKTISVKKLDVTLSWANVSNVCGVSFKQNFQRQQRSLKRDWLLSLSFSNPWTPLPPFSMWPSSREGVCMSFTWFFI